MTFLRRIIPQLEKFPRNQKFLLGDRIENHILDLLELFIKAFYSPKNHKVNLLPFRTFGLPPEKQERAKGSKNPLQLLKNTLKMKS